MEILSDASCNESALFNVHCEVITKVICEHEKCFIKKSCIARKFEKDFDEKYQSYSSVIEQ